MRMLIVLAVLGLALAVCSTAFAAPVANLDTPNGDWAVTYEGDNPVFNWTPSSFDSGELRVNILYMGNPGGSTYFKLYGQTDEDPLLSTSIQNSSNSTWLGWHVDVLNGEIVRVCQPVVRQVGTGAESANWTIQYTHSYGYTDGFEASWVGGSTSVMNNENLMVKFVFMPTGPGPMTIRQYPIGTTAPVPEPSSALALASGMMSVELARIRRRKG